jgi:hypothetical protein
MTVFSACLFLAAIPLGLVFILVGLLCGRKGWPAISIGAAALCLALLVWFSRYSAEAYRSHRFMQAGLRGQPIISALAAYRRERGDYPEELQSLVPQYLSEIPSTGLLRYPEFEYRKGEKANHLAEGTYKLRIFCPIFVLNFDEFIYQPAEDYPKRICGNRVERLGRWAYVHD